MCCVNIAIVCVLEKMEMRYFIVCVCDVDICNCMYVGEMKGIISVCVCVCAWIYNMYAITSKPLGNKQHVCCYCLA